MLTLRTTPPRLFAISFERSSNDLAGLYFDALWRHWSVRDRAVAAALSAGAALVNLWSARGDLRAWSHGWDADEQALLNDAQDFGAHLSMAARKGVHRLLNPGAYPLAANPLKNKRIFAARCAEAGLPAPESFYGPAEQLRPWIERRDAFVAKPNYSSKGRGVVGFRRRDGGWSCDGRALTVEALERRLLALLRDGGLLQQACDTHPALADLSPGALPTLRVMTAINEAGEPEACDRVIRLSGGGPRAVDNFNAGNIVASLDREGRILRGHRRVGRHVEEVAVHPASGSAIAGRKIPDIGEAVALAVRAHGAFRSGFRVIGWDVGVAASGPCLIEGNWNPGSDILALASGRSLGDTRLGAIYRHHLGRTTPDEWRACGPIQPEPRHPSRRLAPGTAAGIGLADAR
jgi:hypothetical protein